MEYLIVMIDYGRRGRESIVDPEITRANVIDRIRHKEYGQIAFIHHVRGTEVTDVTNELLSEAGFYDDPPQNYDRQAAAFDHARDSRKHS